MAGRDDFEARLRRLEQKAATQDAEALSSPKARAEKHSGKSKNPNPGMGNRLIVLLGFATVFGIGILAALQYKQSPFQLVPEGMNDKLVSVEGWLSGKPPEPAEEGPVDPRAATRLQTEQGWVYESPGVANPGTIPMIVEDVATGFDPLQTDVAPVSFVSFEPNPECTVSPPSAGAALHNIRIERGNLPTEAHAFATPLMADALITHIEGIRSGNSRNYRIGKMAQGRMAKVDVFVTDTSAPVYLMLQDLASRTIWNLHLAEGVTLENMVLIGDTPAVAGLPDGTGVEALRVSDFVEDMEFGSNDEIKPCMIAPWRVPQEDWLGLAKAKSGNTLFENQMYSYNAGARAFAAWYTGALPGRTPDENLVSVKQAAHVLAGEVPQTPVLYTPLSQRTALIVQNDHILIGDAALTTLHDATLAAAIGGDVAMLDPDPMTLEGQPQ